MFYQLAISALAAATLANAQNGCIQETFSIGSTADVTALSSCKTLKGNVVIPATSAPQIDLSGPQQIDGDLVLENNGAVISLQSSSLTSVSGTFKLANVTLLSTLQFNRLSSVGAIRWQSLPALNALSFSTGVSSARTVIISDTFLQSLDGINLETVGSMDINNNRRLTKFDTSLKSLSDNLNIQANGAKLSVTMPNLIWIANMTIANVTLFSSPSLQVVNGSAKFDSNYFDAFSAPNMTSTGSGDISFINNPELKNITFTSLQKIGGALTIVNNTALNEITGFPQLASLGGAIKLGGNFSNVQFPKLEDVKGTFELSSTGDISNSCTELKKNAPGSQQGNGVIQGKFTCTSNNAKANTGSTAGDSTSGGSGNRSSAAVNAHINSAVVGLSLVGLLAQLL